MHIDALLMSIYGPKWSSINGTVVSVVLLILNNIYSHRPVSGVGLGHPCFELFLHIMIGSLDTALALRMTWSSMHNLNIWVDAENVLNHLCRELPAIVRLLDQRGASF